MGRRRGKRGQAKAGAGKRKNRRKYAFGLHCPRCGRKIRMDIDLREARGKPENLPRIACPARRCGHMLRVRVSPL